MTDYTDVWEECMEGDVVVCFLLSCYGEGEPTTDSVKFIQYLKTLGEGSLPKMQYVMFGLGDSKSRFYQLVGINADKMLTKAGAKCLFPLGLGDDNKFIEDDFDEWKDSVLLSLSDRFGTERNLEYVPPKSEFKIEWLGKVDEKDPKSLAFQPPKLRPSENQPFSSKLVCRKQLVKENDEGRKIFHADFDIFRSRMRYDAGDHCCVIPENPGRLVEKYVKQLQITEEQLESVISLVSLDGSGKERFCHKTTLLNVLKFHLDLNNPPRKNAVRFLSECAKDPEEKEFLKNITLPENRDKFRELIFDPKTNIADLLVEYPSVDLPLGVFLEICTKLRPRYYSIASCFEANKKGLSLLVGLAAHKDKHGEKGYGICSEYMNNLEVGNTCYMWTSKSKFKVPANPLVPVILISNGTGMSSIRSIVEKRKFLKNKRRKKLGEALFYFGCRKKDQDWLYQDEQEAYLKDGVITKLRVACSRDQGKKVYVQHLVQEDIAEIADLVVNKGARIMVCGRVQMSRAVYNVIKEGLCAEEGVDKEERVKILDACFKEDVFE